MKAPVTVSVGIIVAAISALFARLPAVTVHSCPTLPTCESSAHVAVIGIIGGGLIGFLLGKLSCRGSSTVAVSASVSAGPTVSGPRFVCETPPVVSDLASEAPCYDWEPVREELITVGKRKSHASTWRSISLE